MKIAFVYDVIYPYVKGGVEKRVWELATRLTRHGHEVHLFGMKFWDNEDILFRDGIWLHGICPSYNLYTGGRRSFWKPFYFSVCLISPLLREKFDIIDCQQFPYFSCISTGFVSKMKKIPLTITWIEVWGDYWYEYIGKKGFLGKIIERYVARFLCPTIAVSHFTAHRFEMIYHKPINSVIPIGIDIGKINANSPSTEQSDIIFVGRLIKEKNADLLVKAVALALPEYPELRVLIIGEGPEKKKIQITIKQKNLENIVQIHGFYFSHDDLISRLKASKIFVLPSMREGFGISALEALACGLPVVTIDHPANAIRDLINENNGFLCSLSAEDLANTICLALRRHKEMRNSCILSAESYDWEIILSNIEAFYRSVIAGYPLRK
ncbi:MAG: glycosyltransferase family 4 protein [Methanoregula sp.]|jgi:glycosyltransferase involved in cell wall biosynthesis|nr:glycosyltransferase family 4 protein [Methanoregula sp.]